MHDPWQDLPFADPLQMAAWLEDMAARLRQGSHVVQAQWALGACHASVGVLPRHIGAQCEVALTLRIAPVRATPPTTTDPAGS